MKVLFDLSEIGRAYPERQRFRGVHRVIESLATCLYTHPACETSFVATRYSGGCASYIERHSTLRNANKRRSLPIQLAHSVSQRCNRYIRDSLPNRDIHRRALRRGLSLVNETADRFASRLPANLIAEADIFYSPRAPLPTFLRKVTAAPPAFITVYDLIPLLQPKLYSKWLREETTAILASIKQNDRVFTISEYVKQALCSLQSVRPAQVTVTPLAASRDIFYPVCDPYALQRTRQKYGLGDTPYFITLTAVESRKNLPHLVRCFFELIASEHIRDVNLVLVGAVPSDYTEIDDIIAAHRQFSTRVKILGYVPDEDLASLYSAALAFAFPSLMEGFGLPPLEAMQCGLPIICSNATALPEVVGDAGVLLDPSDRDEWSETLLTIYEDQHLRCELGKRSLARAQLFTWERCVDTMVSAFKIAVKGKG